jgi:Uma2 family endonuclease
MAALPNLITVEQFRQMPEDGGAYELHQGEVVCVSQPKAKHYNMQEHLVRLLVAKLPGSWRVGMEFPYRPVAEFDLRVADVAAVSQTRSRAIDPEDNLRGAPELVIEVKSPSNTPRQLRELASLCLANGGVEFWVVDLEQVAVTVIHQDGSSSHLRRGESISLSRFGGDVLTLDEVFG